MLTEFKLKQHSIRAVPIVEVWYDGKFKATITPGDVNEPVFRVISNHIRSVEPYPSSTIDMYQFNLFPD
jgi:hypothetical protein